MVNDVYGESEEPTNGREDIIDIGEEVIDKNVELTTLDDLSDRDLLLAIYRQQEQLGNQMNWLCENLAGVFGIVTAMSQNGGGVRGLMKVMKEMNANG